MSLFSTITGKKIDLAAENRRLLDTIASLRAQLADEQARTKHAHQVLALLERRWRELLTAHIVRDTCVVCGASLELLEEAPHCDDCKPTSDDMAEWSAKASEIKSLITPVRERHPNPRNAT
jgi:hypothetical protein